MTDLSVLSSNVGQLRIGRYLVEAKLGEGGMAETWLCRLEGAKGFSKQVVVKTMRADCVSPEYHTMFADEARIGARIDHPNIPRVLEFGQTPGGPFLVQEYVDGPSVIQILKRQAMIGRFDLRLGCRIVADVAGALDSAWTALDEQGRPLRVIHRDVSPSNILVSRRGTPKLIDFGVALFVDRETRTEAGVLKGKLRYMAPEVLLHGDVSHQGDLYSLGIVLYSLCVGETPWGSGGSTTSTFADVAERTRGGFPPPSSRRAGIDPVLDQIIQRCLHVDRHLRYQSGRDIQVALQDWLHTNGGPLGDGELSELLLGLFPDGPSDWRADDLTVASMRSDAPGSAPTLSVQQQIRPWRWLMAATSVLLLLACVTLAGTTASLWFVLRPAVQSPAALPAEATTEQVTILLDAAEMAVAQGKLGEAASRLATADGLQISDPGLLLRRAELDAALALRSRIAAIRERAASEPEAAAVDAQALARGYPEHPDVLALVDDLGLRPAPAVMAPLPVVEPPVARPKPAPAPKSPRELLGDRAPPLPAPSVPPDDGVLLER